MFPSRPLRISLIIIIMFAVAGAANALAAANTVPESKAGDGDGDITGYVVSSIHYNLNAAVPSNIDSVEFTLDSVPAAGSTITIQLNGATWYSCTNAGADVTCTTAGATVLPANNLRVIVAD